MLWRRRNNGGGRGTQVVVHFRHAPEGRHVNLEHRPYWTPSYLTESRRFVNNTASLLYIVLFQLAGHFSQHLLAQVVITAEGLPAATLSEDFEERKIRLYS